jgi:hypothetical protein
MRGVGPDLAAFCISMSMFQIVQRAFLPIRIFRICKRSRLA